MTPKQKRNWELTKLVLDYGVPCEQAAVLSGLSKPMGPKIVKKTLQRFYFLPSEWQEMDRKKIHLNKRIEEAIKVRERVKNTQKQKLRDFTVNL